jgi:hypothetical protein
LTIMALFSAFVGEPRLLAATLMIMSACIYLFFHDKFV